MTGSKFGLLFLFTILTPALAFGQPKTKYTYTLAILVGLGRVPFTFETEECRSLWEEENFATDSRTEESSERRRARARASALADAESSSSPEEEERAKEERKKFQPETLFRTTGPFLPPPHLAAVLAWPP